MTDRNEDMAADVARHNDKMAKKKAARDKIMAGKTDEKGLVIVHTGKGKGKSSAAFGMIFRCIAHQLPCAVGEIFLSKYITCKSSNLVYCITCKTCKKQYVGQTKTRLSKDSRVTFSTSDTKNKLHSQTCILGPIPLDSLFPWSTFANPG